MKSDTGIEEVKEGVASLFFPNGYKSFTQPRVACGKETAA